MRAELTKYTTALARRKSRTKQGQINVAILMQLEDHDVPRLMEMVRVMAEALEKDPEGDAALFQVEALAKAGSSAKWGEYEPPPPTPKEADCGKSI